MRPLHLLLTHPKDKSSAIPWTAEATATFHAITTATAEATLLMHHVPDAPTCIMTDASDTAIDAVIQQFIRGHWHPISYFSCFVFNLTKCSLVVYMAHLLDSIVLFQKQVQVGLLYTHKEFDLM